MEEQLFKSTLTDIKKLLTEENLGMTFDGSYPMKLIVTPCQDIEGQMNMLEAADKDTPFNSPDMVFILRYVAGDVRLQIFGRMAIDDDLYLRIKRKFKTACEYYMAMIHKLAMDNQLIDRPRYGGDD